MSDETGGVSVVIPAMNAADTLAETLTAVLCQAHLDEVIVVVQPSGDDTLTVARASGDSRVRVIEDDGRGIARATNLGIAAARGRWFAKIDADDLIPADRFSWQVGFLAAAPVEVAAVCGNYGEIDEAGRPIVTFEVAHAETDVTERHLDGQPFTHLGTFLCRMAAVREIGGFRPWFTTAEDIDFTFRLAERGRIICVPRVAYAYRLRRRSITHSEAIDRNLFFDAQAGRFARQRRESGEDDLQRGAPPEPPAVAPGGRRHRVSVRAQAAGHMESHAWRRLAQGDPRAGLRYMARSLFWSPSVRRVRGLAAMLLRILGGGGQRPTDG